MESKNNQTKAIAVLFVVLMAFAKKVPAQSEEVQQLLLNIEKLAQFKQILTDLKKGYQIVSSGYSTIKSLSEGNFSLHKTFLDELMAVSPAVAKYHRVGDIIKAQLSIVRESKNSLKLFRQDLNFQPGEIKYLKDTYDKLLTQSLNNLDELVTIITANKLRMSDDERLSAIDRIYLDISDKLNFLRFFNNNTKILAIQRAKANKDVETGRALYGMKN